MDFLARLQIARRFSSKNNPKLRETYLDVHTELGRYRLASGERRIMRIAEEERKRVEAEEAEQAAQKVEQAVREAEQAARVSQEDARRFAMIVAQRARKRALLESRSLEAEKERKKVATEETEVAARRVRADLGWIAEQESASRSMRPYVDRKPSGGYRDMFLDSDED